MSAHSSIGKVTADKIEGQEFDSLSYARYTWRPHSGLASQLPPNFSIGLTCIETQEGVRRFAPQNGAQQFLVEASLAGYVLLSNRVDLTAQQRFSYHAMRLLFQQAPRLKEHLSRSFNREADFLVSPAIRGAMGRGHILPADLGLDHAGFGTSWSPSRLLMEGRASATASGNSSPDEATCIRQGLLAAARLNPFDMNGLSEQECLTVVRLGLFALDDVDGALDPSTFERVQDRLFRALENHIEDSTEDFHRWLFTKSNDIAHAIAKQKKNGGPIPRDVVRQAILELVFGSYTYTGDCLHVFMEHFASALPRPLDSNELPQFRLMYQKQPALGGLPLIMIHDRVGFLKESLLGIMQSQQGCNDMGVLLRLLHFYGEMVSERRAADREYKRRNHTTIYSHMPEVDFCNPSSTSDLEAIALRHAEARGIRCDCGLLC